MSESEKMLKIIHENHIKMQNERIKKSKKENRIDNLLFILLTIALISLLIILVNSYAKSQNEAMNQCTEKYSYEHCFGKM